MSNIKCSFTIARNDLLAMRLLQCQDISRHVINGVHFEVTAERVLLVATDGRRIGILESTPGAVALKDGEKLEFTVNYPSLKCLPKSKGSIKGQWVEVSVSEEPGVPGRSTAKFKVSFNSGAETFTYDEIEGSYPSWRQVVPDKPFKAQHINVSMPFLFSYEKVAKQLGLPSESISLRTHETDADLSGISIFLNTSRFYGVLMPMRGYDEPTIPAWAKLSEKERQEMAEAAARTEQMRQELAEAAQREREKWASAAAVPPMTPLEQAVQVGAVSPEAAAAMTPKPPAAAPVVPQDKPLHPFRPPVIVKGALKFKKRSSKKHGAMKSRRTTGRKHDAKPRRK